MSDAAQRAKEEAWDSHSRDLACMEEVHSSRWKTRIPKPATDAKWRQSRWALQSPSGNIIGMGREKPRLTKEDRREFWRVIRLGR